jgi:sulfatase maturation enzyme AslB (radical SAM superfamily)
MRCTYSYVKQGNAEMSLETAKKVVELSGKTGNKAGIIFFGAKPLLKRRLIYDTVAYLVYYRN